MDKIWKSSLRDPYSQNATQQGIATELGIHMKGMIVGQ
jgi:hypothetical protein